MSSEHEEHMREAIALSMESVAEGGGPFGAVIVDTATGAVIGRGKNRVTLHHDPTAHGEMVAIRDAAKNTGRDDLAGCALYTSAEPCPGCMTMILFNASIKEIYYGTSVADAAGIGFADDKNWNLLGTTAQEMASKAGGTLRQLLKEEARSGYAAWTHKADKVEYYRA